MRMAILLGTLGAILSAWSVEQAQAAELPKQVSLVQQAVQERNFGGGIIVHVGCGEGTVTEQLRLRPTFLVQGLCKDEQQVVAARKRLSRQGVYGPVSILLWQGDKLPYIDNLVNVLVVEPGIKLSKEEILRVLVPGGVAYVGGKDGWQKLEKPWPAEYDDWTHYLHDPSNNAVSEDRAIDLPRHLQWIDAPRYSRHHDHMSSASAMVAAGGRTFYIFDEGPYVSVQLPSRWFVVARDAFNGRILWKRPIARWHTQVWRLKSGPANLPRRLVATDKEVYTTLTLDGPVVALDAATGEILRTYEQTKIADEIVLSDGVLFVVSDDQPWQQPPDPQEYNYQWTARPRTVMAVEAKSGKTLWKHQAEWVAPVTLAVAAGRVLYFDGLRIVCLDRNDGHLLWQSETLGKRLPIPSYFAPTLVVYKDVVLFSGADTNTRTYHIDNGLRMVALELQSGKKLWEAIHPPSGYRSPEDILVINDVVWTGALMFGRAREDAQTPVPWGTMIGRDYRTGKVLAEFGPDVETYWFHHRCYRAKATVRYLLTSRTGIEFIDPNTGHWEINHWVRGACLYGIMPAYGMIFNAPHPCACYLEAKLFGFNALAPRTKTRIVPESVPAEKRLIRGPAYGSEPEQEDSGRIAESDWPTYRADNTRSGKANTDLPQQLETLWRAKLAGRLSAPVVAGGRVYLAAVDAHTLYCLSAQDGKVLWTFTAGGRIDSPPTIWRGRAYFGCADGYVYSLRASDGQLVWRFRAAPVDRQLLAFQQLESVWPVHGSVLIDHGCLWCVAGRSRFLDGGLRLIKLDALTGKLLKEVVLDDKDRESNQSLQFFVRGLNMPVALADILSADEKYIYMRTQKITRDGKLIEIDNPLGNVRDQKGEGAHLFSPTGFLDDSYWHRSYWVYGVRWASGAGGYFRAGRFAPAGHLLVFDDKFCYAYAREPQDYRWTTPMERHLIRCSKVPEVVRIRPRDKRPGFNAARPVDEQVARDWVCKLPIYVKAMVLAGKYLYVAGPPDVIDERETWRTFGSPETQKALARQSELWYGTECQLLVVDAQEGKIVWQTDLPDQPVWDAMAAASGRLFVALKDGSVICLGKRQ